MTIDETGFLSPQILSWIQRHRTANSDWFQLAENLNRIAHHAITAMEVPSDNNQVFMAALLSMRGLSSFQGTLLLAERGMTQDARILVRSCFETVFYLGALLREPEFVEALIRDDADQRGKMARALLKLPEGSGLEAEHTEKLTRFLDDLEQSGKVPQSIRVFETARLAGLKEIYGTYYRGLSNDAAHPSMVSLNRYVASGDSNEVTGLHWGPDVSDVEDTVNNACTAAIYLLTYARECFIPNVIEEDHLERCWEDYKRLVDATKSRVPLRT